MALLLKCIVGVVAVLAIAAVSNIKNLYIAGLVPLFPTFALIAHYIIGKESNMTDLAFLSRRPPVRNGTPRVHMRPNILTNAS